LIAKKYVKTQGEKKKLYTDYEITTAWSSAYSCEMCTWYRSKNTNPSAEAFSWYLVQFVGS
jgi:hypothetical protein